MAEYQLSVIVQRWAQKWSCNSVNKAICIFVEELDLLINLKHEWMSEDSFSIKMNMINYILAIVLDQ